MTTTPANQYLKLEQRYPELMDAVNALGKTTKTAGPIDEKTAHLIQLAAAATLRSEGAVHSHTKRAIGAGATPDEIYHAIILLANTIGLPNIVAAISWADDVIEGA